jgi:thioesterase-3
MEKTPSSFRKVRFQDCDPFNHLNNSKYIDYFINAREDQILEHYSLDIFSLAEKQGLSWVVASHQINYLKPARLMEIVLIESQLIKFSSKSLLVEMCMWDERRIQVKSILWTQFIHISLKSGRSIEHAKSLMDLFETIVIPLEQESITERVNFLSNK